MNTLVNFFSGKWLTWALVAALLTLWAMYWFQGLDLKTALTKQGQLEQQVAIFSAHVTEQNRAIADWQNAAVLARQKADKAMSDAREQNKRNAANIDWLKQQAPQGDHCKAALDLISKSGLIDEKNNALP